ncbi:MAG: hypothetical protein N2037_07060 [Acidimicrobiales bacterium]|nr:hypothetical protein [Acidimicrobiales bacterium]
MTLYADASALLKRYIEERDSVRPDELLSSDPQLVTSRVSIVEVRRNLARLLPASQATAARAAFAEDLASFWIVELDAATCARGNDR